jgi:outer membrane lipoprotein-sorting protein
VADSNVTSFSGTIEQTSDLGLPQVPSDMPTPPAAAPATSGSVSSEAAILELVTGSHTARVYVDGPKRERVQVLDKLAERDAIRNGSALWFYDSSAKTATHVTLPARADSGATSAPTSTPGTMTPPQLAKRFLSAVTPTTNVTLGDNTNVAGQDAYDLVLAPKATDTLVTSVSIAVDAANGLPLSVTVTARGQSDPAFSVAFSRFDPSTPGASLFSFTPPEGVKVTQQSVPTLPRHHAARPAGSTPKPSVSGSGWGAIVTIPASAATRSLTKSPLYRELSTPVSAGRLVHTSLVNILITTDGRVLAGSVPAAALEAEAAAG